MNRQWASHAPGHTARARLPGHSVFRSLAGREIYLDFYDRVVARLPGNVTTRTVTTRFGETCLTCNGNMTGAPLIVLPGMSIAGPSMLEFFAALGGKRRLIAPDLVGQPGLSHDRPLTPSGNAYALWLADILDALGLDTADIVAASFGASIALDLAAAAPGRIGKLALLMPAGLTPRLPMATIYSRLGASWLFYRHMPIRPLLPVIAAPLSRSLTPDNLDYLDIIIQHTAFWRHRPSGPYGPGDLKGYRTPVFLVMAEKDILFPFAPTRRNAHESLVVAREVVIRGSAHMPSDAAVAPVLEEIAKFFG